MSLRLAVLLIVVVVACGEPVAADRANARRAQVSAASDLLPADLDFIVRIDTARLRKDPAFEEALRGVAKSGGTDMLRSVLPRLESARAVLIGGRFMSDGFHGDGVVAIEPTASDREVGPFDPTFHPSNEHLDHARIFERSSDSRDEAVLAIALDGGGVVLATTCEADAVLRVLRAGPDPGKLDPPARGLVAFASRAPPHTDLVPARVVDGLTRFVGSFEGGDAIHLETELSFGSPEQGARAVASLEPIAARLGRAPQPWRSLSDSMKLARDGGVVRLRVTVPFAVLRELH